MLLKSSYNLRYALGILTLIITTNLFATPVLVLSESLSRTAVGEYIEVLEDKGRNLNFTDILAENNQTKFIASNESILHLGYSNSVWWLRISIHNPLNTDKALNLTLNNPSLSSIKLFHPDEQLHYKSIVTGSNSDAPQVNFQAPYYVFPVTANAETTTVLYLRLQSNFSLTVPIAIGSPEAVTNSIIKDNIASGVILGIVLGLALYNIILFHKNRRDRSVVFFILSLSSMILFLLTERGILGIQSFSAPGMQNFLMIVSLFLLQITTTLFNRFFLDNILKEKYLNILTYSSYALTLIMLASSILPLYYSSQIVIFMTVLITILNISTAIIAVKNAYRPAYYILAGRTILGFILLFSLLSLYNIIPTTVSQNLLLITSFCIASIFFALGLSLRLQLLREESTKKHETRLLLETSLQAKNHLLMQISYDIRTPLNGILGMTELLLDSPLSPTQKEFANTIHTSSNSLLRILNEIIDRSRIEDGKIPVTEEPFNLEELLNECISIFKIIAREKTIELIATIDPSMDVNVVGDPSRLQQIISSLLRNAIKHTHQGEIEVRLSSSTLGLHVDIRDTGPGIPPHKISHLFDMPEKSDNLSNLSLCKQLVEFMGGSIYVESKLRYGSRFWFEIPLKTNDRQEDNELNHEILQGLRLLVANNNMTINRVIHEQASHWGMRVRTSDNANTALALARNAATIKESFDIILIDQDLNNISGLQLATRIREDNLIPSNTIIILLANPNINFDLEILEQSQIKTILHKPLTQRELKESLLLEIQSSSVTNNSTISPEKEDADILSDLHILIAEDNHISQKVIKGMMKKLGVHATIVTNGREVVEEVSRHDYDIVLMDCDMPFMDGYAATHAIREWEKFSNRKPIPILALTAHILDEHKEKSLAAGMNEHISKPFELQDLQRALIFWAKNQIKLQPAIREKPTLLASLYGKETRH